MALPTLHVQNELSGSLRLRNRKSLDDSINGSLDESGYATSLNNSTCGSPPSQSTRERNTSGSPAHKKWPETPPPVELQQRWGATPKDIWGTVVRTETFKDLLPVAVAFVVMTSCIVLVCTLTFGLDRDPMSSSLPENLNGKYRSIAFANSKRLERFKRDNSRIHSGELKDDEGVPLGGKRAAIQFAHNLKNEEQDGSAPVTETSESVEAVVTEAAMLDKLTFRMPANIIKNLKEADLNKPADDGSANEAKRDLETEQPDVRVERDSAKSGESQSVKRNQAKQPFRFAKRESVKDESDGRKVKRGSTEKKTSFRKFEQTS